MKMLRKILTCLFALSVVMACHQQCLAQVIFETGNTLTIGGDKDDQSVSAVNIKNFDGVDFGWLTIGVNGKYAEIDTESDNIIFYNLETKRHQDIHLSGIYVQSFRVPNPPGESGHYYTAEALANVLQLVPGYSTDDKTSTFDVSSVESVAPNSVSRIDENNTAIDFQSLVPLLVGAIQELQNQISDNDEELHLLFDSF